MNNDQGFCIAEVKEEGKTYHRYDMYGNKVEYVEPTQSDYMEFGEYPTVVEMIEMLSTMPSDAKVCYYYDSHIHGSINMVYESNGGVVIMTTDDEMRSMRSFAKPKDGILNRLAKYPDGSQLWFKAGGYK